MNNSRPVADHDEGFHWVPCYLFRKAIVLCAQDPLTAIDHRAITVAAPAGAVLIVDQSSHFAQSTTHFGTTESGFKSMRSLLRPVEWRVTARQRARTRRLWCTPGGTT
jgi:hypothetical protein